MTFNEKIDNFMKVNNYKNLKQLALDCGIPYTTLNDFYNKKSANNSRLSTIRKLSKFMKCTMDYLAYDEVTNPNMYSTDFYDEIQRDYIYTKTISDEDGYSIEIKTTLPFEQIPKDEQQEMIDNAMEELLKVKKEAKQKDNEK